ncbi:protein mono-ADP-ribosyltransferase PARP14 [Ictalurus punctatus]|uniref:Protein mono-ADP-ribosyltransferase PARP14 n=1 Tax=Ictalurus punctatus TaxID=7998 RepID=A0A2D0SQT3_ICTPU|nr:protein mono-ADP-ribosyltransferase PARP14 [Ictalurus punctatus]
MEEYPYPVFVEGDWSSINAKTLQTKLHVYFQSKKKSQGGDCVIKWSERRCTVFFRSEKTRDRFLSKRGHAVTIENQVVKLKVSKPSSDSGSHTDEAQKSTETGSDVATEFLQPVPAVQRTCSVRVDDVPADAVTNKQLLELYFETWGGAVEKIITNPEQKTVIIIFQSQDAVQRILDKTDHSICKVPVTIQPYFGLDENEISKGLEDTPQSSAVVIEKVPDHLSREFLMFLVDSICGASEDKYSLELIPESNTAVVTFNDAKAAEKFLLECQTKKRFQDHGLMARSLEISRSIKVENLPAECANDFLELYFDKWGGAVEKLDTIPDEQAAIVTFHDQEAVKKLIEKKLCISNNPINIYPYYTSLGSALYGKDRATWTLPKPFTDKIHPAIREFLQKKGQISSICNQMSSHFCQVNMDNDDVLFSPLPALLRQKGITKKHIDNWKQDNIDAFKNILSSFGVFEYAVIPSVWTAVEKDIRSVVKDKAVLEVDFSTGCLTLAGMANDINMLKPILEKVLKEALSQMEREKNKTSESIIMSPGIFFLFQQEGLQHSASAKYPQLELMYKKDTNQLTLTGLPVEILHIKNMILERQLCMKEKILKMDSSLLEFLRSVDSEEMSGDLFISKRICAVYRFENGNIVLTASTDKALAEAEEKLYTTLTFQSLSVEDQDLLGYPEWQDLTNELYGTYNLSRKKTVLIKSSEDRNTVVVCGFKEPVTEVSKSLEQLINSHDAKTETGSDLAAVLLPPDETQDESKAVVLEKMPENFTREVLMILVDSICGLSDNEYFLELISESNTAVVTFNDPSAAETFFIKCRSKEKYKDYGLTARALEKSKSVKVENLPAQCPEDLLELYFDKWGGMVERIDTIPDEQAAIVTFHDQEAVKKILKKKHLIRKTPVDIYPYYPSLCSALYGKDRPTWTLPKSFTVKILPAIREFLQKKGQISSICNQMSSHFCQVNMDNDDVLFSPLPALLRQKGITKKHIDNWKQDTIDAFKNILSGFGVFEYAVIPSVWTAVEKDIRSVVKENAVLMMDASTGCLTLAGMTKDINMLKPKLENFLKEASLQMEKEGKGQLTLDKAICVESCAVVKFIKEKMAPFWQKFLKRDQVKIHFDPKRPLIRVSGERIHVQPALNSFQKIARSLHTDRLTIRKAGAKKYFEEQEAMVMMMIKEQRFVVVLEDASMEEEDEDSYNEESDDEVRAEDFGQLFCEVQAPGGFVIKVLKADICQFKVDAVVSAANEDLKHNGGLALALLNAAGPSLQQSSDQYVAKHGKLLPGNAITTEAGHLPCKYVVHAVGPRYYSTDKFTAVKKLRQAVRESLNQAEFKRCSSIAVPAISSGTFGFPLDLCTETIAQELHVYVEDQTRKGGRNTLKEIHLVDNNPTTANAMAQAVKKEFTDFKPRMTFPQQMGRGSGHCTHGHHDQNYRGHGNRGQGYRGQGACGHRDIRARGNDSRMYRAKDSEDFETQRRPYSNPRLRTQFEDKARSGSGFLEAQSTKEGLKIILRKGNIQDARSAVIVNTVSEDLDLSKGAVSKALLSAAGPQLQAETYSHLKAFRTPSPNHGDIVATNGYNLNCLKVFHTVCPFWSGGHRSEDEILKGIIQKCLIKAENQKMVSISFPAIGTGNLGFPRDVVSRIFLSEIRAFSARVSPQYLNEVTVIVHPSDSETVQCFVKSFRGEWQGSTMKGAHVVWQSVAKKTLPVRSPQSAAKKHKHLQKKNLCFWVRSSSLSCFSCVERVRRT